MSQLGVFFVFLVVVITCKGYQILIGISAVNVQKHIRNRNNVFGNPVGGLLRDASRSETRESQV